jgi:predicted component of type VI protein secretion system
VFELNIFLKDKLIGRSVFETEEVRIGRAADNEVQIDNLGLSRYHASIENVGGVHILKDFGSQNGTFVNGQRMSSRLGLNDGDRISIGKFTLLFRCDKGKTEAANVGDEAAYAVAGETIVTTVPETRERACPFVAYLESTTSTQLEPPKIHHLAKDIFVVGSGPGSDLALDPRDCPSHAAAIVRGWRGFQLLALAPVVLRNGAPVELRTELSRGDELSFGAAVFRYQVGRMDAGV